MAISRRDFFKLGGGTTAAIVAGLGRARASVPPPGSTGTTLDEVILKGAIKRSGTAGSYRALVTSSPGEPHLRRQNLSSTSRPQSAVPASLLHFVHLTDSHLVDAQSPARVEFLDRYNDGSCGSMPFDSAQRAQEALTLHVQEAMIRRIRAVALAGSPVTGAPPAFAVATGDNTDNEQYNEVRWFIDLMDGNSVNPNSGNPLRYEGVQAPDWGDEEYWHPNGGIPDKVKRLWGFPDGEYDTLLGDAIAPIAGSGVGMPWYQVFGNHDGLMQGNAPRNEAFNAIAVGPLKVIGFPGVDPCDQFSIMRNDPAAVANAPAHVVGADPARRVLTRREYIQQHFTTSAFPLGHGFSSPDGPSYWVNDEHPGFRIIGLDTVNPGGLDSGSIGQAQFDWLVAHLQGAHSASNFYYDASGAQVAGTAAADRLVIIVSHHGLRSLTNQNTLTDPSDPSTADLPRKLAGDVAPVLHRFPNLIAWVNGHTHNNIVTPQPGLAGGFWDVGTSAHIDFPSQARLVEVTDNGDETLSIFCTMIDHAAPASPAATVDPVLRLASISRELCANDYQRNTTREDASHRNVELVIRNPIPSTTVLRSSALWLPRGRGQVLAALGASGLAAIVKRRMERGEA